MSYLFEIDRDPTQCPEGHEDCQVISDPETDLLPDEVSQGYFCYECERTYRVVYLPATKDFI